MKRQKDAKQLERHFKGIANHWRIQILLTIASSPQITVEELSAELDGNQKTISEHTRRLVHAGLISKKYLGRNVAHTLSPHGKRILAFIKSFRQS